MLSYKVLFVVSCFVILAKSTLPTVEELSGEGLKNAENILKNSLSKLVGANYRIGKINAATHQNYNGDMYTFVVDLLDGNNDTKKCEAVIWSQLASKEENVLVFIQCQGALPVFEQQSP